jgi:indole-3-glycerol phosphate synthase
MRKKAADAPPVRHFAGSVLACNARHKIIAEIKRFSPGNPKPRSDFDPVTIAKSYEDAGAAAISVLTDPVFFGGSISFMTAARDATSLPVLCKDFFLDPFQIYEARANGADAILLMAVNFESKSQFTEMIDVAKDAGVEAILEIHNESEIEFLPGSRPCVMINNRDFRDDDLRVDISATKRIAPLIKSARLLISASGLKDSYTLDELKKSGVDAFLIGSSLMGESDPGAALRRLLGSK